MKGEVAGLVRLLACFMLCCPFAGGQLLHTVGLFNLLVRECRQCQAGSPLLFATPNHAPTCSKAPVRRQLAVLFWRTFIDIGEQDAVV